MKVTRWILKCCFFLLIGMLATQAPVVSASTIPVRLSILGDDDVAYQPSILSRNSTSGSPTRDRRNRQAKTGSSQSSLRKSTRRRRPVAGSAPGKGVAKHAGSAGRDR